MFNKINFKRIKSIYLKNCESFVNFSIRLDKPKQADSILNVSKVAGRYTKVNYDKFNNSRTIFPNEFAIIGHGRMFSDSKNFAWLIRPQIEISEDKKFTLSFFSQMEAGYPDELTGTYLQFIVDGLRHSIPAKCVGSNQAYYVLADSKEKSLEVIKDFSNAKNIDIRITRAGAGVEFGKSKIIVIQTMFRMLHDDYIEPKLFTKEISDSNNDLGYLDDSKLFAERYSMVVYFLAPLVLLLGLLLIYVFLKNIFLALF
jgi:hypothetical protein